MCLHLIYSPVFQVNEKEKQSLSDFRRDRDISEFDHVMMLKDLGWTVAEFEAGKKG